MRTLLLTLVLLLVPSMVWAYPSSVIFSPNGETQDFGNVGVLAYTSTNFSPQVSAGASWFGVQLGTLPHWAYGKSGVSFGGLEVGFDIITPFGIDQSVKPVFNAKLGIITEGKYSPSVAVGIMEISPAMPSMDYVFVSATKTLGSFGRLTLGYGANAGDRSQFSGTFPFTSDSRLAFMAGYESPTFLGHVGLVADWFGGVSEVSDLYLAATFSLSDRTTIGLGVFLDNDRSAPETTYDGMFAYFTKSFDLTKP